MNPLLHKAKWLTQVAEGDIRPYVYVRPENRIEKPGTRHQLDWFPWAPIYKNPLDLHELEFAEQIYHLENTAFGPANMQIPRWVFYDCAVMPGFVAGFAMKTSKLPEPLRRVLRHRADFDWTPLSLFIIIPTMKSGEWVAHNLCAVNSLLEEKDRLYALGFLSKAFGLWYANVETCCGMTQWGNSALKLHVHFGHLQIVTAFTPVHSHAQTVTYRSGVNTDCWRRFFSREDDDEFLEKYVPSGMLIEPSQEESMISLHTRIQNGEGPFFLGAADIAAKKLTDPLIVYRPR